ncbi:hypothetical protein JCM8547_000990 [Rhodosporidiobolus lusitaniae]
MSGVFSEPTYVLAAPATAVLSETRATHLSPSSLIALNHLLDETLHIVVHAALHSPPASTTPTSSPPLGGGSSTSRPPSIPFPLGPNEVLTTDRVKSAFARILGPTSLAKEGILEAELAVRELIRRGSPSLRGDGALKKSGWGTPMLAPLAEDGERAGEAGAAKKEVARQANEVFRALRVWVMQLSALGAACYGSGPAKLEEHLVALSPPKPPPEGSNHLTFLFALYIERIMTTLSLHLLRLIAAVSARSSQSEVATLSDVEVALMEDDLVWSWAQGLRVRRFIEEGSREEREKLTRSPSISSGMTGTSLSGGRGHKKGLSIAASTQAPSRSPPLPSPGSFSRKPSLNGAPTLAPALQLGRRSSIESSRSGNVGLTYAPGRKGSSTGLGISSSPSIHTLDGDAFDELLSSGKTIKMSSTPDRLRTFDVKDGRRRMSASSSMPTLPSSSDSPTLASSGIVKSSSSRRLQARDPQRRDLLEDDEEEDTDSISAASQQRRKESLKDILNSPPPWSGSTVGEEAPPLPVSRRASLRPGGRPVDPDDPTHPISVAMRVQDSGQSNADSLTSGVGSMTSGDEAYLITAETSPGTRMRALKAKDERDLAKERQVNTDLMDFFSSTPPLPASGSQRSLEAPQPPLSPKRSKGGLRGLVGKITGKKEDEAPLPVSASPRSPIPLPEQRTSSRSQSIGGISMMSTTIPSIGAVSLRAAGFSESAAAAAYKPPPGLGSPKQPMARERRSGSLSSTHSRARSERERKQSLTQQHPPLPIPPGILKNGSSPLPSATSSVTGSDTPTPSIRNPPKRSSSLKRNPRERELSAATIGSARSSASPSPVPSSARRTREESASSTCTATSSSSLQPPSAETSSSPVVLIPNSAVGPMLGSQSSKETLGAASSEHQHEAPPLVSTNPAQPSSTSPAPPVSTSPPSEPPSAPLRNGSTTPLHTPPTPPRIARFSTPSPRPSPPLDSATPRGQRFSAPSPTSRSPSRSPHPQIRSSAASPPLRSTSPLVSPAASYLDAGGKSLVTMLKELRSAMRYAQTKEECVELVEALLRDNARRVEANAQRENEEREEQSRREEELAQVVEGEGLEGQSEQDEQTRLVEFFLSGGDLEPLSLVANEEDEQAASADDAPVRQDTEHADVVALPLPPQSTALLTTPELRIPGGFQSASSSPSPAPTTSSPCPSPAALTVGTA